MSKNRNFEALFPVREIEIAGECFALRPFTFGQLPVVVGAVGSILDEIILLDFENGLVIHDDGTIKAQPEFIRAVAAFLASHSVTVFKLLAMATGWEDEDIESLPPDEGLKLCVEVFTVNKSFFTERLAAAFKGALKTENPAAVAAAAVIQKAKRKG